MRRVVLAGIATATIFAAGTAVAADIPVRRYAPVAPVLAIPVFSWTGFYAGLNAGFALGNDRSFFVPGVGNVGSGGNDAGFTGGGQLGYNWQIGQFVLGVEADLQYANLRSNGFNGAVLVPGFVPFVERGIDWFGTGRGRLGYAIDRTLIYGTGGFAYGGGGGNGCAVFGPAVACTNDDIRTGWTVGGGLEFAFTNNVSARLEGLYVNLDRNNNGFAGSLNGVPVFGPNAGNQDFGVVRGAINYKFW